MIKTTVIVLFFAFIVFAAGFLAGVVCAASGAAENFEEAILETHRKKGKKDGNHGL